MALEDDFNYHATRHAETPCPGCQMPLTGSSNFTRGGVPKPGDLSVCIYCSTVLIYVTGLTMRKANSADLRALTDEERVTVATHVKAATRARKRWRS